MGNCCSSEVRVVKDSNTALEQPVLHHVLTEDVHDSDDDLYGDDTAETTTTTDTATNDEKISREWQEAVQSSNNKKLKQLFQTYSLTIDFATITFENGDNSLHFASRSGNVKLAKLLILIGTKVNETNEISGNTALHYAVSKNDVAIVELLLSHDCDVNIANKIHKYPKDIARDESNSEIIKLLKHNSSNTNTTTTTTAVDASDAGSGGGGDTALLSMKPNNSSEHERSTTMATLDNLADETHELPRLKGYLDKKRNKAPYNYQRRWVVVAKPYILWNDKLTKIKDGNDAEERKKFSGYINILSIQKIEKRKSKTRQTKFIIVARDAHANQAEREYVFRCESEKMRDQWVAGLKRYLTFFHEMQNLLI